MISLGFVATVSLIIVMLVVIGVMMYWHRHNDEHSYDDLAFLRWMLGVIAAVVIFAAMLGLYPYNMDYHSYDEHTGTIVAKDESTFNVNEDNQYRIALSDGTIFRSDDYRFVTLKVGDVITVLCIKEWHYAEQDTNACHFNG